MTNISEHVQHHDQHHDQHRDPHHVDHDVQHLEIHVNKKPVKMIGHRHTGLEIKKAAIDQHVKIKLDFLLYLVREHQPNKEIGDNEPITITNESHFHAIADDDNS